MRAHLLRTLTTALVGCAATALIGCATTSISDERRQALEQAVAASQRGDAFFAARAASRYLTGATEDDPAFDRARVLLARALESAGFSYAASLYYGDVARERRDPRSIPEALAGIERIARSGAHDRETLIRGFLAASELPELPAALQGFVEYEKGLDAMQRGDHAWAERRFSAISTRSTWYHRARYVLAVRDVARGRLGAAADSLSRLAQDAAAPDDVRREALRALARLHLSEQRYAAAQNAYEALREQVPRDPELLLELAWTHYYLGHPRRALGLLMALDAPVHRALIAPERFLLEAMCLRRLCQFEPARLAAARLSHRYAAELAELYSGTTPARSLAIRRTARTRGEAAEEAALVDRMAQEARRLDNREADLGEELTQRLRLFYSRGLQETRRRESALVTLEAERLADELLQAEEGVRLILHELGVAILRGHSRAAGPVHEPPFERPDPAAEVGWGFVGEFWTDELDDLVVRVEDRCILD